MRIAFSASCTAWALALLAGSVLCACAQTPARPSTATPQPAPVSAAETLPLPSGGGLRYSPRAGQSVIELIAPAGHAATARLTLTRDQTIALKSGMQLKLIGESGKQVLIVSDQYASRPGSMSYCQAGHEEFLRVLSTAPRLHETFKLRVQSCLSSLELADPGIVWKAETSTLEIHWLTGPTQNDHNQTWLYHIDNRGEVKPVTK